MQVPHISQRFLRLLSWRRFSEREAPTNCEDEQPLRAELFSANQLEQHAKSIAATHQLTAGRSQERLLPRLDENAHVLIKTYDLVTAAAAQNLPIEPAAEWLLDNFYLIEEQIRAIRRLLPPSYSKQLPRLANGPGGGYSRVYGIALELISHVDGHIDETSLNSFIASYQSVESLMLGELWAVLLMFRLALIENLRRVAVRIALARRNRDLAGDWADRMVQVVEQNPTDLILVLADMARWSTATIWRPTCWCLAPAAPPWEMLLSYRRE